MICDFRKRLIHGTFLSVSVAFFSCSTAEQPLELEISVAPKPFRRAATDRELLANLDRVTLESSKLSDYVRDVRAVLAARVSQSEGRHAEALKQWYWALGTAEGRFGKRAFEGWVRAYTTALGRKTDAIILARLLLAETHNGAYSPYMTANRLTSEAALAAALGNIVPEWLDFSQSAERPTFTAPLPPPKAGIPENDPVLASTVKRYCAGIQRQPTWKGVGWENWVKSLAPDVQRYWQGLALECTGNPGDAIETFKTVYPDLAKARTTANLALEAIGRSIKMRRASGERETVADDYQTLMDAWKLPGINEKSLGIDRAAFLSRRIDETLWAARYRALVGDLETGKIFAQQSLELISATYNELPLISEFFREELTAFRAEAYHFLAFRVALERQEIDSAIALNAMAQQIAGLNQEWKNRLSWAGGLYEFLGGNFEAARRKWEAMMVESPDEPSRALLYFWLSRVYTQLNQKAESDFYLRALVEDYPLSFYSVVAVGETGNLSGGAAWKKPFENTTELANRLKAPRNYNLSGIRSHKRLGRLLARAEILVAADLEEWARLAVDEFDESLQKSYVIESNPAAFVYLSRLHFAAGSYLNCISLTTQLASSVAQFWSSWPEQILVSFPRPFSDVYARAAAENGLDESLLMGISRQESSFNANAKSPASAYGVMQLIRRTALQYQGGDVRDPKDLEKSLLNPAVNIMIGSRYLRELNRRFNGVKPAVYGSYNAGEYAVDAWMTRRAHSDPMVALELIPYGETKSYVRNVWRNVVIYDFLRANPGAVAQLSRSPHPLDASAVQLTAAKDGIRRRPINRL